MGLLSFAKNLAGKAGNVIGRSVGILTKVADANNKWIKGGHLMKKIEEVPIVGGALSTAINAGLKKIIETPQGAKAKEIYERGSNLLDTGVRKGEEIAQKLKSLAGETGIPVAEQVARLGMSSSPVQMAETGTERRFNELR